MTTLTQAQATAAKLCLKILTDAGLIGENLVTKLRDAQQAIGECLPKMYAACREVENDTGKNMFLVSEVVVQMFSRAKWADHDAMMNRVESGFRAMVEEALKVQAVQVEVAPATVDRSAELVAMARNTKEGLEARITKLTEAMSTMDKGLLNEFLIVGQLGCVAYGLIDGRYASHSDITIAPGFQTEQEALAVCGPYHLVKVRAEVLQEALSASMVGLAKMNEFLGV
ncbi:MAG: hypothetical protein ACRCXB_26580 [Aeromonadaceae bacterium]